MTYRIEDGLIIRDYTTPEGGTGMHCIPMEAIASRMALLGLDTPGQALDAILAEADLGNANPYAPVYAALAQGDEHPIDAHVQALDILPTTAGCDGRRDAEFKERLTSEYGEYLNSARQQFIEDHTPPRPEGVQAAT